MKKGFFSLLLGLFLILLGASALLRSFGFPIIDSILHTFWPLFIIGFAVSRFMVRDIKGGIIMGVVGIVAQLNMLGYTDIDYWALLFPLILIMIGSSIIMKGLSLPRKNSNVLADTTIFGGLEKVITDQEFASGSFVALFGATMVDFKNAKFLNNEAVLDVLIAFGGAEIKVNDDVKVEMELTAIFGGSSDKRTINADKSTSQTLKVKGYVLFGAIEVKD